MHGLQALTLLAMMAASVRFSGESALEFTRRLVALGPRESGTEAHLKMERLISAELRKFGCAVEEDVWTATTPIGPKRMNNIIVKIPGRSGSIVAVTGHYDTKMMPGIRFVGANDGGSSAGFLLEMARVLCGTPRKDSIWLIWFDGEEAMRDWTATDSLYGSRRLAARWRADGTAKKIKALINVDMIGDKDLALIEEWNSTAWLRDLVWRTAAELGYSRQFPRNPGAIEDDHAPFLAIGVPALDLIDFEYGPNNSYWHSEADTVDKLGASSLQAVGNVLLRVIEKLEAR